MDANLRLLKISEFTREYIGCAASEGDGSELDKAAAGVSSFGHSQRRKREHVRTNKRVDIA
jgi:hypothetical protein